MILLKHRKKQSRRKSGGSRLTGDETEMVTKTEKFYLKAAAAETPALTHVASMRYFCTFSLQIFQASMAGIPKTETDRVQRGRSNQPGPAQPGEGDVLPARAEIAGVGAPPANFEAALMELETIVASMEEGELPLEHSLAAYKRGAALLQYCQSTLKDAEQQIKVLEAGVLQDFPGADDIG